MNTISFIGNSEPPERLLSIWKKLTPNNLGIWGNLKGIDNYDSDYYCVIDKLPENLKSTIDEKKCVFLGAHPESVPHGYCNMSSYKGLAMFDCKKTLGFLETWLTYDYNYLINLQPIQKTKKLACIMSDAKAMPYQNFRRNYLEKFCDKYADQIDVYGRIKPWGSIVQSYKGACGSLDPRGAQASGGKNDHMSGKEFVYESYKYVLEFDADGEFYFSERVLDSLALYSMPLYWGGRSLHKFIPENSFRYLDIERYGDDVIEIINSSFYEDNLEEIKKAKAILLNELQLWPRVHNAIFGTFK